MKYIGVFCSANDLEEKYTTPAKEFAKLMTEHGYNLVWGGSDRGLMRTIASAVQDGGGKIVGVTIARYQERARKNADEMILASSLGERKATILERSDAIVVLVGGIGTLDELSEMLELKKQGKHNKPIVVLNTDNFYEGIKVQLQKMKDDGFLNRPLEDFIYFADKPIEAIEYIVRHPGSEASPGSRG
ncbi:MAG TPA: TIGR00730 family Rossman fold protein [Candidatus Saccharimonadales bacterium]|nr:TIGR00730 family Rossman fold protein [Candidatus Saccharimonadales bacterium]